MFIINAYNRKVNACSPWTSCFFLDALCSFPIPLSSDIVKHELLVASYELRVEGLEVRVEIWKCDFKSTSYVFKSTNH